MSLSPPAGEPDSPRIARHFNNQKPAVVESALRADMPVTVFRLWRCDGAYQLAACEADTIKPRRRLMGANGLARLVDRNPREWFDELCCRGMPHHVAVFRGYHSARLRRFAQIMGFQAS
jgi:hypothetical protein